MAADPYAKAFEDVVREQRIERAAPALLAALTLLVDANSAGREPTDAEWRTARGALAQAKG